MEFLKEQVEDAKEHVKSREIPPELSPGSLKKSLLEQRILQVNLERSEDKIDTLMSQIKRIHRYSIAGIGLGLMSMLFGFWFWYTRVQSPADKKAMQELDIKQPPTQPVQPPSPA